MDLDAALKKLGLSDAEFGALVGAHSTLVWKWRKRKVSPGGASMARILAVLKRRGVVLSPAALVRIAA